MFIAKMPDGKPEIYGYVEDAETATVQGEGITSGLPCVFCRLSNCNLACKFCDTFYTWHFDTIKRPENYHNFAKAVKKEDYQMIMTTNEVAEAIRKVRGGHRNVVFTGGEPTMQQIHLVDVMKKLREDGQEWHFEVETNGTLKITEPFAQEINQINCSPKLKSSGNLDAARMRPEAIARILEIGTRTNKAICFKFVVFMETWESDLAEIQEWEEKNKVPRQFIWLMPEGVEKARIETSTAFLNKVASKENYRVSTRIQILIYGSRRAV